MLLADLLVIFILAIGLELVDIHSPDTHVIRLRVADGEATHIAGSDHGDPGVIGTLVTG